MIPRTVPLRQAQGWRAEMARAYTDVHRLLCDLQIDPATLPALRAAEAGFPLRVPYGYAARMRRGDANDPLLRQVLALAVEDIPQPGFAIDAVGDLAAMPVPGLLHKYHGRALLIATGACAVHCRNCVRRHFPYGEAHAKAGQWRAALDYIAADTSIAEVILSGGDPLMLDDAVLAPLITALDAIPHLRRLRIHTRLPIVLPQRIDAELLTWLSATRLGRVVVVHANHAHEIDAGVRSALSAMRAVGATVLNQAVLLGGVNDDAGVLCNLSEALFDAGVLPYYLHRLDAVHGAAHYAVPEARAQQLLGTLRARLPGYLVPRLVREVAGAAAKLPVG